MRLGRIAELERSVVTVKRAHRQEVLQPYIRDKRILDVGCIGTNGPTGLHEFIRSLTDDVVGIDSMEEPPTGDYPDIIEADAQSYMVDEDNRFDTIVAGEVIEHLSNPGQFLNCCRQNLKPGGHLIITTPNALSFRLAFNRFKGRAINPHHKLWFDPVTLTNMATEYGFEPAGLYYRSNDQGLARFVTMFSPRTCRSFMMVFSFAENNGA